jgi:hypothetical protein
VYKVANLPARDFDIDALVALIRDNAGTPHDRGEPA